MYENTVKKEHMWTWNGRRNRRLQKTAWWGTSWFSLLGRYL